MAPIVVLAFLGTVLGLGTMTVLFFFGAIAKKPLLARLAAAGAVVLAGDYGLVWIGSSLLTPERTLRRGELKYFCEIDCHIAYSIEDVRAAKALGSGASQAKASGTFLVVAVKTWFDPSTTSLRRPAEALLWPNPRHVVLVDGRGRVIRTSPAGQAALSEPSIPLTKPLLPGQSYVTRLVFDLPADARQPRLLLTAADFVNPLLIGDENGPLHRKIYFDLGPIPRA